MKSHEMGLQPEPFEKMRRGEKTIELRLNDEKRSAIAVGDEIYFLKEPDRVERIITRVIELLPYASFADIAANIDPHFFGHTSKETVLEKISQMYSKEDELRFGVLGIRIETTEQSPQSVID